MTRRRVVVTGMEVVTPIGVGLTRYWEAVRAGTSGVRRIDHFDPEGLPCQIASTLTDPELLATLRGEMQLDALEPRGVVAGIWAGLGAARAGQAQAVLASPRAGVFVGTSGERQDLRDLGAIAHAGAGAGGGPIDVGFAREFVRRGPRRRLERLLPQYLTSRLAGLLGVEGPSMTVQTACTSSAQAIGEALRAIQRGSVDVALAGGAECIVSPVEMQLFCLLGALSTQNGEPARASRPFDARRDGFVMGEAAAFLVLEEAGQALARGATVLVELAGYGTTCDAYRITDEAPDGHGAVRAMRGALADAHVEPDGVDYVNAHGTATAINDRVETHAIKQVFGPATRVAVSSTKSMLGHTLSAAGAVELVTTILGVRDGVAPPTINYEVRDPACDLDYVPNAARPLRMRAAISNSFGFGGHCDCLCVTPWAG